MNKRELVLAILDENPQSYIPAGFFLHFNPEFRQGQPAVEKHLEFFNFTEMDFVKIQFEHPFPAIPEIKKASDWDRVPIFKEDFFEQPLFVVEGLVKSAKPKALVIVTLYSPFMIASQMVGPEWLTRHVQDNPTIAKPGIEIAADAMLTFVKACIRLGVDGFYMSTQGAETFRFPTVDPFLECIKPYDLFVMNEARRCTFNILHICDYHGGYSSLDLFVDYPGQVVNCNLHGNGRIYKPQDVSSMFNRPFMGGLERKGVLATGNLQEVKAASLQVLNDASKKFILAADCTVPSETPWENLREAIRTAHSYSHNRE